MPPTIYLIAGCNGAEKTTFARDFLLKEVNCLRFLNADEIARGLSPLDPSTIAIKAGRVLVGEIRDAIARRQTFGLESTLSGLTHIRLLKRSRRRGYKVLLIYLWLSSPKLAVHRVRERVRKGGSGVPATDIRRRFHRSLVNLTRHYLPLADSWVIFDNSGPTPRIVAEQYERTLRVADRVTFDIIRSCAK